MALNFPDTPSNGQIYLGENGIEYKYNLTNDSWTGRLKSSNVPIDPSPVDVSVDPAFGNPSGTNPGSGTLEDPFIITDSIVPTIGGSTESLQTITITNGKTGDQVLFTNNTTPYEISAKYTQPIGVIDGNGSWTGKLIYNDALGAETTANISYTGNVQVGNTTVYFRWVVQQQATPPMIVTVGSALTGQALIGTELGATQPTVTGGILPYTYSYQWQTSDNGADFTGIPSATSNVYTLVAGNVGKYIRCASTVSDSSTIQTVSITSNTAIVNAMSIDVTLNNTSPKVSETITANAVIAGGVVPVTTTYQWKADDVNIAEATSTTYTVIEADKDKRLSCRVTTTDTSGTSVSKTSDPTDPVFSGTVPEINTVTLAEVTPDSPDRYTDQSFTVSVDMTSDNPKPDYALRGKVLGDLTVEVATSVIVGASDTSVSSGFAPVLYTGNPSGAGRGPVDVGFAPDLVWIKRRDGAAVSHNLMNSLLPDKKLESDTTDAVVDAGAFAFTSNGFKPSDSYEQSYGDEYVAWCWDAGDTTVTNNEGTVPSQVRSNGNFSISTFTADTTGISQSFGHGLTIVPSMVILKALTSNPGADNWFVYHQSLPNTKALFLNSSNGPDTYTYWGDTTPTDSVVTFGQGLGSADWVAYCWVESPTQNFGSYTGNGLEDGPTIECGFEPAFVLIKNTTTDNTFWTIFDDKRGAGELYPNEAQAESYYPGDISVPRVTLTSTGFKCTSVQNTFNGSGDTMIYAAFGGIQDGNILTLTDTTGLSSINVGDTVVQNSSGTPVTSAITNVSDEPGWTVVIGGGVSANLYGTAGADKYNVLDSDITDFISIASPDYGTYSWTRDFASNPVPINSSLQVYVQSLDAFNPNEIRLTVNETVVSYINIANRVDTLVDVPFTGQSQITSIKLDAVAGTGWNCYLYYIVVDGKVLTVDPNFGTVNPEYTSKLLTLQNDTNLANFRVGDVVGIKAGTNSSYNQTRVWTTSGSITPGATPIASAFDGSTSTFCLGSFSTITYTLDTPLAYSTSVEIYSTNGSNSAADQGLRLNGQQVSTGVGGRWMTVTTGSGVINSLGIENTASSSNCRLSGIRVDGLILVDAIPVSVTAISEATPSITTTNDGSWSGIDGTGDAWNQSQEWSAYGEGDTYSNNGWAKAFDGVITNSADVASPQSGTVVWTPATPIPVSGTVTLYLLNENNSRCFINGFDIFVLTGVSADGYNTPVSCSAAQLGGFLQSISLVRQSTGAYLGGVEVDGSLLVDLSIPGAPETFVTGPTQAAASGTVKLAGAREEKKAIQTSVITNVDNNTGEWAEIIPSGFQSGNYYCGANDGAGTMVFGLGAGSTNKNIFTSTDNALTFEAKGGISSSDNLYAMAYGNGTYVAGGTQTYYSTDGGQGWTLIGAIMSGNGKEVASLAYGQNKFLAGGSTDQKMASSPDGINWTSYTTNDFGMRGSYQSLAYGDGKWVVGGLDRIGISTNGGTSFTGRTYTNFAFTGIVYGGGYFVAVANSVGPSPAAGTPKVLYSIDGTSWSTATGVNLNYAYKIAYGDGLWMITTVSGVGSQVTSNPDNWNNSIPHIPLPTSSRVIQFGNGVWAAGDESSSGRIFTSTSAGAPFTMLTLTDDTDLARFTPGDLVKQSSGPADGQVSAVKTTDKTMTLDSVTGTWAANGSNKAIGPVQTTEVAGPYLTLNSSSGRWLVTESDYNTSLKLNKFVKASSLQSVASLFTVMDNSGNITDLSSEDPGYTPMVGDPTYTTTFPSIFPSGQTPDVELPPGTKYQVEVKATNTFGTDTKVSNDVMPVAGLLQTSVITASEVANYSNTSNWETIGTATVGNAPQNAFDGSVTTFNMMLGSDADLLNVLTGTKIPLNLINVTKLEIYIGRGGTAGGPDIQTCINNDNSNFYENPTGTLGWQDISSLLTASAPTGVVANIVVNLDLDNGEGFDLYAIRANGVILIDGAITLTTTDNTNYNLFSAGDAVVESSGGTPVTSDITSVGTTPWPLWNNAALNWTVTGGKTSYDNGGDSIKSALPTGSFLYTEFTIVGTAVQRQLGIQFYDITVGFYDNNIVGWYFNGSGGSKAVWLAGGDSNSSMGAGMGGTGQSLYTKADHTAGVSSGSTYGSGDVLGYAIDANGRVWVSLNGAYLATAGWYAAGNGSPVPGVSGYVATLNSNDRYFGAQYNGGQTFVISAAASYPPLQTLLTFNNDTNLANLRVGDEVSSYTPTATISSIDCYALYDDNQTEILSPTPAQADTIGQQSYFNNDINDANKTGNKGLYLYSTNSITISYSGLTAGDSIGIVAGPAADGVDNLDQNFTVSGDVTQSGSVTFYSGNTLSGDQDHLAETVD